MKRTPLKRKTGLKRSPLKRGKGLRRRSPKMKAQYEGAFGRRMFVSVFLADNRDCEIKWSNCQEVSRDVHEVIPRGKGGAILPGEKADRQGQRFVATCRQCHSELDLHPKLAYEQGWLKRIPNRNAL